MWLSIEQPLIFFVPWYLPASFDSFTMEVIIKVQCILNAMPKGHRQQQKEVVTRDPPLKIKRVKPSIKQ